MRLPYRCFVVALLCVSGCATVEREPETPPAPSRSTPVVEPPPDGGSTEATARAIGVVTRAFIFDLLEGDVDGLASVVAFPLSLRMSGRGCADATSQAELAEWATCVVGWLPRPLREREGLENLQVYVWGPKSELPEPAKSTFADAQDDFLFANGSYRGAPDSVSIMLAFRKQPSLAVTTISLTLVRET